MAAAHSAALTIWPNETAPADMAKTAPACAAAAKKPSGASAMNCAKVICAPSQRAQAIKEGPGAMAQY